MAKKTALYGKHENAGAKIVEFGGFLMPVQYAGIISEHKRVRTTVGVFDVSHMGEFIVEGPLAERLLNYITINNVTQTEPGQAQYTVMCHEDGGIIDDLLIYRYDSEKFMTVVNASNIEKDWNWINQHNSEGVELKDISAEITLLAIQGPDARNLLQKLTRTDLNNIGFYRFVEGTINGIPGTIARTGYTGELGYELYVKNKYAEKLWDSIMDVGKEFDVAPIGLGARDTLRIEMGFCLYGNDIDRQTNPLEAGLGWVTKLEKGDFIGRDALLEVKQHGITRKRIGFELIGRGIPRHGYPLTFSGNSIGKVTSGTQSPMLNTGIGMGYVAVDYQTPGTTINVKIRNRELQAEVVKLPFYQPD